MILIGDALTRLRELPSDSAHCCVTSPPYWGLRDYGAPGQLGLEATPEEHVAAMVAVFREVRRVLRPDGTLWLNYGDCYAATGKSGGGRQGVRWEACGADTEGPRGGKWSPAPPGLKPKDLVGMPWRVAFALQADGWWLRSDIIWCLSGGTRLYAKTQKGEAPHMLKDLVRLDPATVQLWNGERWTQVLGWSETPRPEEPLELELRSGERIGCTPGHQWPTQRGLVRAADLRPGDVLQSARLPDRGPGLNGYGFTGAEAWFVGLYIAEGSMSGDTIQIASHADELTEGDRLGALQDLARKWGGTCAGHRTSDNGATINLHGPVLRGIIEHFVSGSTAKRKHLNPRCWAMPNDWLEQLVRGYLEGDGHWDAPNSRWRIGFTRNDYLAADLRTLAARLGTALTLKATHTKAFNKRWPTYRGEWRRETSGHRNRKPKTEIVKIRRSRARRFWDVGVADEPHLFALASGVLTHNSKPNPMPESVTDRPTCAHEYLFLLAKSPRYFYDADAIRETAILGEHSRSRASNFKKAGSQSDEHGRHNHGAETIHYDGGRNRRTVWTVATHAYSGCHFATFPPKLITPCILAGTSERGCCSECGSPWVRVTSPSKGHQRRTTTGWRPTCDHEAEVVPCTVLDPFGGSGTTAEVAIALGRRWILIELNPDYEPLIRQRTAQMGLFGGDDGAR